MTRVSWTVSYCTNSQHGIAPQNDKDVLDSQLLQGLTQSTQTIHNDIDMPLVVRIESLIPIIAAVSLISSSVYVKRCIAPWLRFWCLLGKQTDRQTETDRETDTDTDDLFI